VKTRQDIRIHVKLRTRHLPCEPAHLGFARCQICDTSSVVYATSKAGTGKAVTDLIFSIAKRDVTFFNATAPISFL